MRRAKVEPWAGGRVRTTADGERRWELRRMVGGVQYEFTLEGVATKDQALRELARFTAAPEKYKPLSVARAELQAAQVFLDQARVDAFLEHLEAAGRSDNYLVIAGTYLARWAEALAGKDLRRMTAKEVRAQLASWATARKHRIIVFKSCCSWLVSQGVLAPEEDPGRFLTVPADRRTHESKAYRVETVERLYSLLPTQYLRDLLCLLAKTGMHVSEAGRMAAGEGALREVGEAGGGGGEIAGTVAFVHKTGARHVVSLDAQAFAAAQRLVAAGRAPSIQAVRDAQDTLARRAEREAGDGGFERVNFGALRHSFATWAVEGGREVAAAGKGLSVERVAERLGHTNSRTTKLHYLDVSVPPMIVVPITLRHPDDPPVKPVEMRALPPSRPDAPAGQPAGAARNRGSRR